MPKPVGLSIRVLAIHCMEAKKMTIRVILADDHPAIILGVRHALNAVAGISVVAEAPDPKILMEKLGAVACDVLVTDFSMPCDNTPDGLVMLNSIRRKFPAIRVVVLTMLENPALLSSMSHAGALAILNKRYELSVLPEAIVAAFQRRPYRVASSQLNPSRPAVEAPDELFEHALSSRELEVVRLYVGGMTLTEVALHLNRSIKTISTQKQSAMRKLGLSNDPELYDYAMKQGLRA
ncbi:response regulator transcription factor [Pseudomonas arcuscaelestis]|uniref:response regulator transcription factor n=1 Tax=Pseudomonas arcuscaelestis TaxID=2710591 RepID=UPI001F3C5259|nr:response regulator transcription factor [Pseudomonas arcuscaelestis]